MCCCCATNVKAAFVLGIVLAVLSFLGCFKGSLGTIINGILSGLIHCILIFGTHTRNSIAILVWMVLAIFSCIGNAIIAVMAILVIAQEGVGADAGAVESVQDFLIKLDMKPCMRLVEMNFFY